MNTLLLEHSAAVSKIAAYRQAREHQEGVDCTQGYLQSYDAGLLFEGPRTLECLFRYIPGDETQVIAGFGSSMMEIYTTSSGNQISFHCGNNYATASVVPGDSYLAVIAYDGATAICYLNGTEAARFPVTEYKVADFFRTGSSTYTPQGPLVFCRHYNYALSAKEVAAHYNDGDPAGYVLPAGMKYRELSYQSDFSNGVDRWEPASAATTVTASGGMLEVTGTNPSYNISRNCGYLPKFKARYRIRVELGEPISPEQRTQVFPFVNNQYIQMTIASDGMSAEGIFIPPVGTEVSRRIYLYLHDNIPGTIVRYKSIVVEPIGCVAEYLPQNLIVARKQDFPQLVFPIGKYTPSANVYSVNNSTATLFSWNRPQANGFSGEFMRFEAATVMSLYDSYWLYYFHKASPIKTTFEYRSSHALYTGVSSANPGIKIADANEGAAKLAVCYRPSPGGEFNLGFGAATNQAGGWLELRVISIEVVEGAVLSWLDSAKQLPLNDEYLPPLLEPIVIGDARPVQITGDNSYTWTGTESPYNSWVRAAKPFVIGTTYRISVTISNYESGSPFIWLGSSVNIPAKNGTYDILLQSNVAQSHLTIYGGPANSDRRLTVTVNKIEPVPERGYDLAASGAPEIVYKMTQRAYIIPNLMDDGTGHSNPYIGLYFNDDQQDATYSRVDGKIVANIGSYSSPTNRPMVVYYRFKFVPGRYYRISIKWSLISGSYFLESFSDWSTDRYEYTGDSLHTEPGGYEYTTPLLKARDVMTLSYRPIFIFTTRQAHSEFSIDEVILEEYE